MGAVSRSELVIERGEGVHVFDDRGPALSRRHREPLVREPRPRARGRDPRRDRADGEDRGVPDVRRLLERAANELCARLAALAPMEDAKVFLASGGGDAIDTAAKIARRHWILAGAAGARPHPQPHARLPRDPRVRDVDRRDRGQHGELGPADPARLGRRLRLAAGARGGDPARRARARRRVLLRAGDRRRRRPPPARGLHRGRRRPLRGARDPAGHRLGDLRLRPARDVVRHRALAGRQAGPDHVRQGRDQRLPAARRRDRRRRGRRAVLRRARRPDAAPRRHLRRPSDLRGRGARGARRLRGGGPDPARAAARGAAARGAGAARRPPGGRRGPRRARACSAPSSCRPTRWPPTRAAWPSSPRARARPACWCGRCCKGVAVSPPL